MIERLLCRITLLDPDRVRERLLDFEARGQVPRAPNPWQVTCGVLRMWGRILFRSETIGTSVDAPVRDTWRARLLAFRPLRFPFLLAEGAITPWDLSGLYSDPARVSQHLICAHHDGHQFVYDFELLACDREVVEALVEEVRAVVSGEHPRAEWLRDLTVFEGYHEALLEAAERALRGELLLPEEQADDPDMSFLAYLRWCAEQPPTLRLFRGGSLAAGRSEVAA
ncbi:MAG: hypothetical protein R3B72_33085 [Polyangiaceae bacterium]